MDKKEYLVKLIIRGWACGAGSALATAWILEEPVSFSIYFMSLALGLVTALFWLPLDIKEWKNDNSSNSGSDLDKGD